MNNLSFERNNSNYSFENDNILSRNNFEKKFIIGKGGFSKVINYYHFIFYKNKNYLDI